jgi:putative transposase
MYDGFLRGNRGKKNIQAAQKFGTLTSAQMLTNSDDSRKIILPESALVTNDDFVLPSREIPKFSSFQLD